MAISGIELTERPWAGSADSRLFASDPGPGNPNVGRAAKPAAAPMASPAAPAAPAATEKPSLRTRAVVSGSSALGKATRTFGPTAAGFAALGHLGDYRIDDPDVDSSAMGTLRAVGQGDFAGAGRSLSKGMLEAGMDIGSMVANAADLVVPGKNTVSGAYDRTLRSTFGDQLIGGGVRGEREAPTAYTPSLRVRPEDTMAGPPTSAMQSSAPTTADASAGVRRIDRPGQSPLFTDMPDGGPLGNDKLMGRGAISPQNMAAANNLAATDSLRSQGAAMGSPSTGTGIPAMAPTLHSGNSWEARNNLRNLELSASSIYNSRSHWGNKAKAAADAAAYQNAQAMDTAARTGSDPGSVSRTNAQASMFGSKTAADASRYSSDNSLRGTMYSADSQLGAKRMEMERSLRQQQLMGGIYQAAGGDPAKAAKLAASYGLDGKSFQDMAAADQTRTMKNAEDARDTFKDLFLTPDGKIDKNAEANAHIMAAKIVPGWENMSAEQRAANRTKVVDAVKLVQGMNSAKDTNWAQKFGLSNPNGAYSQLPELVNKDGKRAQVGEVGWWEGMTTPNVSHGDTVITLPNGTKRYLRGQLEESQAALLEQNGAQRQR